MDALNRKTAALGDAALDNSTNADNINPTVDNTQPGYCSGFGQYHSENHKETPRDYIEVSLAEIISMIRNPPSVTKPEAQWAIFSTLKTREHAEQKKNGKYSILWADIDEVAGKTFLKIAQIAGDCINGDLMAYTSRSATEENQKTRILIRLAAPVTGEQFVILQKILNDKLQAERITPDRVTERAAQICYLPNRGEFYECHIDDKWGAFNSDDWSTEVTLHQEAEKARLIELQAAREAAKRKAIDRMAAGCKSPIDAFNETHDLDMMLESYGYTKRGTRYCSPNSGSGSAGVSLTSDGSKWLTCHSSDEGIGKATKTGTMGDAFDLFVYYEQGGDWSAAVKAAGAMFNVGDITLTEANQQAQRQPQATNSPAFSEPFNLLKFSMNGNATKMEADMQAEKYVLGQMAILGQSTLFYAKPNAGKTLLILWLLMEKIKTGEINGEDVFYINADDTYRGLVYKLKLAEKHGFQMLAPGHNGFKAADLASYLFQMINSESAKGKILILDTVKKFTDLMNKKTASKFGENVRQFVSHGGTVICLAHVNKHRDDDQKVVYSGTTDLVDDADCAYTLDTLTEEKATGLRTVRFENFKSRGDVTSEAVYRYNYADDTPYYARLESIEEVGAEERAKAEQRKRLESTLERNQQAIEAIKDCIRDGITQKTALIKNAHDNSGVSKSKISKALSEHTGSNVAENQFWHINVEDNNAHVYQFNWGIL